MMAPMNTTVRPRMNWLVELDSAFLKRKYISEPSQKFMYIIIIGIGIGIGI